MERPDGTRLAAIDFGGSGRTCVLVHGAGLNARCFAPLALALGDAFHCVGLDLSGHGRSPAPARIDWTVFVEDVVVAAAELGGDLIGLGHSLGATALLGAEASRPGVFSALFCYEPIVIDETMPDRPPAGANADLARRRRPGFASRDDAFARFSEKPPFAGFDPAALAGYLEEGLVDREDGSVLLACRPDTEAAIYESAPAFDVLGLLARVACPVTVAFGEASAVFSRAGAEVLAQRLPNGRIAPIPGLDHFGPFSAPELVAETALRALRTAAA